MKHWQRKKNETKGILDKTGLAFIPSALVCVDWWLKLVMTWGSVSVVSEAEVGVIFVVVFIVFTVVFSVTINLNFFFFLDPPNGSNSQLHTKQDVLDPLKLQFLILKKLEINK